MFRRSLAAFAVCASCAQTAPVAPNAPIAPIALAFDFTRTLRVDYFHTGGPGGEALTLDAVIAEGAWPGSETQLIDTTNLGKYFFEVIDSSSNRVIYSRGFASIYGEWETTPEFRAQNRTFHESLRFPWPTTPVRIGLKKRDKQNVFEALWSVDVDPRAATTAHEPAAATARRSSARIATLLESGPPSQKVDV